MDMLMKRIQAARLTAGQQAIAKYFLKNQNRICAMTSLAVAREIGVSDASIIRFSRAIGYAGFAELKADFYSCLGEDICRTSVGDYPVDKRLDIQTSKYRDLDLASELLKLMLNNAEQSIRQNSARTYEKFVDALAFGRKKVILGLRGGKGCAVQFGRLLGYLMDEVQVITTGDSDDMALLQRLQQGDVVLAISYARYYKTDPILAGLIKEQGAALYTLADSMASPLAKAANAVLLVETRHMGFSNSTVGTACVLEYLLTMLCWKYPKKYQTRLEERGRFLQTLRLDG